MKITVLAVGRIRPPFDEAEGHYMKMLRTKQSVEVVEVKDDAALIRRLDPESHVVALDLAGKQMDSEGWARWLDGSRHAGRKVTLLIGGPGGLPPEVTEKVNQKLSLGLQTLAHQLARIVLLEQIFRASKILAGEKYHL
ncbi:MAG: 23S rRNA (pseudouridine(1915)-N(3))-methyltransferase RlmH [Solirubrobacterales bacterium]|nr:23S rRNA (pseudouridine(1915)-N(3))-methyltransferase RlmH [Solirubrobacterales bacterium]